MEVFRSMRFSVIDKLTAFLPGLPLSFLSFSVAGPSQPYSISPRMFFFYNIIILSRRKFSVACTSLCLPGLALSCDAFFLSVSLARTPSQKTCLISFQVPRAFFPFSLEAPPVGLQCSTGFPGGLSDGETHDFSHQNTKAVRSSLV